MLLDKGVNELCLLTNGTTGGCSGDILWRHTSSIPEKCGHVFSFRAKPTLTIVFPVYFSGALRRFCLCVGEGVLETYSHAKLRGLVKEAMEAAASSGASSVEGVLQAFFKTLISYYHRELSDLDNSTESFINGIISGVLRYEPINKLYTKASHLHRGVHGIIYAIQSLDRFYAGLRDLGDEAVMLENMYSTSIDRITQAFNLYYTLISEKTNRVVTKLTIISAIFLPLSLIAGIYGMNFKYMPELQNPYAYPATLAAMAAIAIGELAYFRLKKWI